MANFDRILQEIRQYKNNRQVLIWGAWKRGRQLEKICTENNIQVHGYIDSAKHEQSYESLPVFDASVINKDKYYIVVSLVEHPSVFATLEQNGCQEWEDYVYPEQVFTITRSRNLYEDRMGNCIKGSLLAVPEKRVEISGASILEIGKNVIIDSNVIFRLGWNSHIKICDNAKISSNCTLICQNNSEIIIGEHSIIRGGTSIRLVENSQITIGKYAQIGNDTRILISNANHVCIGDYLLGASNVKIQGGNGHAIMDIKDKQVHHPKKDIFIGEHTWLCWGSIILSGSRIGEHSIVGAASLVNREFPAHVILAGNPANIVREQVDWCMDEDTTWEEYIEHNLKVEDI